MSILYFTLNNFKFSLLLIDDSQLIISAEQQHSLKRFQTVIPSANVRESTAYIFSDLEVMQIGLTDAFEHKDPAVHLSFSENPAQLTYSWQRTFRDKKRIETFTLSMIEQEINETQRLMNQIDILSQRVSENEERIAALEKENRSLKCGAEKAILERVEVIEKRIIPDMEKDLMDGVDIIEKVKLPEMKEYLMKMLQEFEEKTTKSVGKNVEIKLGSRKIKQIIEVKNSRSFDSACPNAKYCTFSNRCRTITFTPNIKISTFLTIFAARPILKSHKETFSVRIDSLPKKRILIGVCPATLKYKNAPASEMCFYAGKRDNICYDNETSPSKVAPNKDLCAGSIISVEVDLSNMSIIFKKDQTLIYSGQLKLSDDYYPFVALKTNGTKVTFI